MSSTTEEVKECPSSDPIIEKEADLYLQKLNGIVVNNDHQNDATLDAKEYRNRYETLLGALKLAHTREASLVEECQQLHTQHQTLRVANDSKTTQVDTLNADLSTLKSLLESANEREDRVKMTVRQLQEEVERLTDCVDKSEISNARKESEVKQLASDLNEAKGQVAAANEKVGALEIEKEKLQRQLQAAHLSNTELSENNASLKEHISEKNDEIKRVNERRERVCEEWESSQFKLKAKTKECIDEKHAVAVASSKVTSLEKQLVDSKKMIAVKEQELKDERTKNEKLNEVKHEQKTALTLAAEEIAKVQVQQKKSLVEHNRLLSEKSQLERDLDAERKIVQRQQQMIEDAKAATRLSNDEGKLLKKEIDRLQKRETQFSRDILSLKRENGLQLGKIQTTEQKVKQSSTEMERAEQLIVSLEKEVADVKDETAKQQREYSRLEGECDGLRLQVKDSQATCRRLMDDLKVKGEQQRDLNKVIDELNIEVDAQKKKNDGIRVDMNNILKDLTEAQRSITNLEEEKKSSQRLIDTLRSEISTKDSALVKEHYEAHREKSQKEIYVDEISRLKRTLAENEDEISTHSSEVRRLGSVIRKLEDAASDQARETKHVINERDILGTSLQRRNTELALLYEKIKILQSTTRRGELQYTSRLDDIRILKIKIRDLKRQLSISQGGQAGVDEVSRSLILVQKELLRERRKVKALSDELENPLNVHRWRKLEGADPDSYEQIQKIKILQKRLLLKSEDVVKQNCIIQEQKKRVLELETALSRQPGSEMAEQLNFFQNEVRNKNKQIKAMAAELNMQQLQVSEARSGDTEQVPLVLLEYALLYLII